MSHNGAPNGVKPPDADASSTRPQVPGPPVVVRPIMEWQTRAMLTVTDQAADMLVIDELSATFAKIGAGLAPRRREAILKAIKTSDREVFGESSPTDLAIAHRMLPVVRAVFHPGAKRVALDEAARILERRKDLKVSAEVLTDIRDSDFSNFFRGA